MKRILCFALCLLALAALFSGCAKKPADSAKNADATVPELTEAEVAGIHYCGLSTKSITAEQLAAAVGVDAGSVIATELSSGEELLIINDVTYNDILYKQLQCINYEDKSVITLTYVLNGEETEGALNGIADSLAGPFGAPSSAQSSTGDTNYTWRAPAVNENYILLYPLTETELKLSFYLY